MWFWSHPHLVGLSQFQGLLLQFNFVETGRWHRKDCLGLFITNGAKRPATAHNAEVHAFPTAGLRKFSEVTICVMPFKFSISVGKLILDSFKKCTISLFNF